MGAAGATVVEPHEHHWRDKKPHQDPELGLGDKGYQVKRLQKLLARRGFDPQGADGVFGKNTAAAVRAAQKANGLDVDGIVGPLTWRALLAS
jgi:peptidoglycan hydrolase-like protein with peptidoglycan-binding domain